MIRWSVVRVQAEETTFGGRYRPLSGQSISFRV